MTFLLSLHLDARASAGIGSILMLIATAVLAMAGFLLIGFVARASSLPAAFWMLAALLGVVTLAARRVTRDDL